MLDLAYIIPAHNAADTIAETLASVLAQRGPRIHALVVDDGSNDNTADVARAQRDWRIQVVRQANQGLAGARNTGLEVLGDTARHACFLDADDTVEQGHALALVSALDAAGPPPNRPPQAPAQPADVAACAYRMLGPRLEDLDWTIDPADADFDPRRLLEFNPLAVGAVALRVDTLRALAGDRPFDESLPVHEDWALWLRLAAAGARWAGVVHEHLFNYRLRPGSLSKRVDAMWRHGRRLIDNPAPHAPDSLRDELDHARPAARRRWTLRHLARAAVAAPHLIPDLLAELDTLGGRALTDHDHPAFLGSLRHAFMLEHALGPAHAADREADWREHARDALHAWPNSHPLIDALSFTSWDAVASRIARLLGRVGGRGRLAHLRPVVAGMGRNGRALAQALAARAISFDWLDDDHAARAPVRARRLSLADIAPRHLVIVTPTSPQDLVDRLRPSRALVMTPAELVATGHEHPADIRRVA